ncbi:afadin- and alpha-actinin-binding protein B isoform X2 [Lepisosteus oculatus]|uniref:afadin- and alpha-actinin-binding protein B isoform X2 n=1 Tax=Lepisosteus oculatus TaxID=7918 RepID=UPI0035F5000E
MAEKLWQTDSDTSLQDSPALRHTFRISPPRTPPRGDGLHSAPAWTQRDQQHLELFINEAAALGLPSVSTEDAGRGRPPVAALLNCARSLIALHLQNRERLREAERERGESGQLRARLHTLKEKLEQRELHLAALQDRVRSLQEQNAALQRSLRSDREQTVGLQYRCSQQAAELRASEQRAARLKDRLAQLVDKPRDRRAGIEILNLLPRPDGKRAPGRVARGDSRGGEEVLRQLLERREAELQEAESRRQSLSSLLRLLSHDMATALGDGAVLDCAEAEGAAPCWEQLSQSEAALGDHVTGGVVQVWSCLKGRLEELSVHGPSSAAVGTDQEKQLAQLEAELEQSHQLIWLQQQLLQDSVSPALPPSLTDSYFLEEWERLQAGWAELDSQRHRFQRERRSFTEAAIRLGHERRQFEQQRASLVQQQFLSLSPLLDPQEPLASRKEPSPLSECLPLWGSVCDCGPLPPLWGSGCDCGLGVRLSLPGLSQVTPSHSRLTAVSTPGSGVRVWAGQGEVGTPSTPELYRTLRLPLPRRASMRSPAVAEHWTWAGPRGSYLHSELDVSF